MSDDVDPNADAQERAAKPTDREWQRLRRVEAAAKQLLLGIDLGELRDWDVRELRKVLWPEEDGG